MYIPKTGVVSDRTLRRVLGETYGIIYENVPVTLAKVAFRLSSFIHTGLYHEVSKKYPKLIIPEHDISFNLKVLNRLLETNSNQTLVYDTSASLYEKSCEAVVECAEVRGEC